MAQGLLGARLMRALLLAAVIAVSGCAYSGGVAPPGGAELAYTGGGGDFGATPGGVKDIGQARALIDQGQVPSASLIMAEGLFSEHDFPAEGGPCADLFCARPAAGRHLLRETGKQTLLVHVGMLSGLPATWKRPPADIMVAVDKGASMVGDLKETMEGINGMIDRLGPDDRFGAVVFDDRATVLVPLGRIADKAALKAKLLTVPASGGFQGVVEGPRLAFDALAAAKSPGRLSRMMMFACGFPPTSDAKFDALLETNAAAGIGASFFGILLGGDYSSARYFSDLHGGNAYFLNDLERVKTVFETDLDLMITPLAYDLSMKLKATGATVKRVWGLPQDAQSLEAKTIFASRNKGAIVIELDAPAEADVATLMTFDLSYRATLDAQPTASSAALVAETKGGVRKAAAVVNLADGLKAALTLWEHGKATEARTAVDDLVSYLEAEAKALGDAQLEREVQLLTKLRSNMK